jgi:hypothetical protein
VSRLFLTAAAAALLAGAAQAQRVDIDPARTTSFEKPILTRPGELIASEISETDFHVGLDKRTEQFAFTGRAGEVVTARTQSDIRDLEVVFMEAGSFKVLARGSAKDAPLRATLPKDGTYFLIVGGKGPQRFGKYLLSFGSGDAAPPFEAPRPTSAPVQVAQVAAPRVEVGLTGVTRPFPVSVGQLIAGEISEGDYVAGPARNGDVLAITARAGETVTAQLRSEIPGVELHVHAANSHTGKALVEGPATAAPLRFVAPKAGTYLIFVHAKGPARFGKYLLSIGDADGAPAFDPPKPRPVQVAEATTAPKPKPAPAALPPLPAIPGVTNVRVGQTLARPAGKPGAKVEIYAFIGEAGSILQASAAGAGRYGATLYTPEGAEMLTATGQGAARLDAVLPKDGIYLLAIARQDAAKPYKLALAAEPPDDLMWSFRSYAGYETLNASGALVYWTCWVVPGSVLQYQMADGSVQRLTTHRDGAGRWELPKGGYGFTTRLEGAKVVRTSESGSVQTWSLDDPPRPHGAYRGYLCR